MRLRAALALLTLVVATLTTRAQQQDPRQPTFRAGVDLLTVEAQVVDRAGRPVLGLTPGDFEVTVGGARRQVALVEMVRLGRAGAVLGRPAAPNTDAARPLDVQAIGRQYYLAFDALSFDAGLSAGVVRVAQDFVRALEPEDRVGVFAFPLGPRLAPTTDHDAVLADLAKVTGQKAPMTTGRFNIRAADVIDYSARSGSAEARAIVASYCTAGGSPTRTGAAPPNVDQTCATQVGLELNSLAVQWENEARLGLLSLVRLFEQLRDDRVRTTVVLFSAGVPTSDRPGARPELAGLPEDVGRAAARANALLYSIFIDRALLSGFVAENRAAARVLADQSRDAQVAAQWLERTTDVAGGALLRDLVGVGATPARRVLDETSVMYLVGVERGTMRADALVDVRISVKRPGATVRARRWVMTDPAPVP